MEKYIDRKSLPNKFDNLHVDVKELYKKFPIGEKINRRPSKRSFMRILYKSRFIPYKYRIRLWNLAHQIQLDIDWFYMFSEYWSQVLGGRPLRAVHDLYFLKNWYRVKFQSLAIEEGAASEDHLDAWQKPAALYQLLHYAVKETLNSDIATMRLALKKYGVKKNLDIMEYGCSLAPITTAYHVFYSETKNANFYITDIQTLAFHYAVFKFSDYSNIYPSLLSAENDFQTTLTQPMDMIFCLTVFEHLNEPLITAQKFYKLLKPGGLLVFDYIKSEAGGLDTQKALDQRNDTIQYFKAHFEMMQGELDPDATPKIIILKKPD